MNTEEHLNRIVAKCRELLAIAERRTPGKWHVGTNGCDPESGGEPAFPGVHNDSGLPHGGDFVCDTLGDSDTCKANAAFIANCAGPAEAGWRATIAAIEGFRTGSYCYSTTADALAAQAFCKEQLEQIIAAWPEELLS